MKWVLVVAMSVHMKERYARYACSRNRVSVDHMTMKGGMQSRAGDQLDEAERVPESTWHDNVDGLTT
jgi:hypothetical protein